MVFRDQLLVPLAPTAQRTRSRTLIEAVWHLRTKEPRRSTHGFRSLSQGSPRSTRFRSRHPVRCPSRQHHRGRHLAFDTPRWEYGGMDEQTYDNRVRALEDELGISTSDAQAMVDAEDVLAQRRG